MFQKIRFFFLLFLICCFYVSHGQEKVYHTVIQWNDTLKKQGFSDNKVREVLNFRRAGFEYERFGSLPVYTENYYIADNSTAKVEVKNPVFAPIKNLPADINQMSSHISGTITPTVLLATVRKRPEARVFLVPVRRNPQTGGYEKLVSFDLAIISQPAPNSRLRSGRSYAANSILSTGTWYKIAVAQDGIYKLDKSFFTTLGISTTNINPANIRIYGNGGGMLPELNAAFRYDDLQENAIQVVGGAGGKFNDNDYVLFYGQGPVRWKYDSLNKRFTHLQNLYSNYTYYFINVDLGAGKRIVSQLSSTQPATQTFNYFNDYQLHELDTVSLIKSGRIWFGEEFQFIPSQGFSFNVPNILCDSLVTLVTAAASYSPDVSRTFNGILNGKPFTMGPYVVSTNTFEGPFADYKTQAFNFSGICSNAININLTYSSTANQADGWLDYLELNVVRKLAVSGGQTPFRVPRSSGAGKYSQYIFQQASSQLTVWDVTTPVNVMNQNLVTESGSASFTLNTPGMHEFVAFDGTSFLKPTIVGKIANQNLHALSAKNYIVVTTAALHANADDLANFHAQGSGLKTLVVNMDQIYNEFGNGSPDATALRDFVKMLYDRATDSASMPRYLVLFGDASYDYKDRIAGNTNLVPTYESVESLNSTSTFNTDDYFGCLDSSEGNMLAYNNGLDVAVGRLPVKTTTEAGEMVNKIKTYVSSSSFGSWRNNITFCADDEDSNTHLKGAEDVANLISQNYPSFNIDKIYLDAYHQVSTPGGSRYPDVNTAITNKIAQGTLIFNYVGHGDPTGLAAERILSNTDFIGWTNCFKLPLFVTATCDFSVFDNPQATSAGEYLMLNPCGGAIAMVTTVRLVYSFANEDLNTQFNNYIFTTVNGAPIQIGTALQLGKNHVTTDPVNNHKFCLLGDPAISLQSTTDKIITSSINTKPVTGTGDTIKALEKVTITGYVANAGGTQLSDFNGTLYPTLFDKPVSYTTLSNDGVSASPPYPFLLQDNTIYNGKVSVKNGAFTFTFVVPKDISYKFGFGKISYYAYNNSISASGYNNKVIVGGFSSASSTDVTGPAINLFMNDEKFVFGGTTDQNPTLVVNLKDENGINTVGTGLGHDITGVLDNNSQSSFVMNDFYEANLDDFTSGKVSYPLKNLAMGRHSVTVKAWDVYDNSSQGYTEFIVANSAAMALTHVLNYPNPFTSQTEFMFEHNMPGSLLDIQIDIYTVSGRRIKTIRTTAGSNPVANDVTGNQCSTATISGSYRVDGIKWDGLDDYGDPIGKGVYVYKVSVRSDNGLHADKFEKLVLLK